MTLMTFTVFSVWWKISLQTRRFNMDSKSILQILLVIFSFLIIRQFLHIVCVHSNYDSCLTKTGNAFECNQILKQR